MYPARSTGKCGRAEEMAKAIAKQGARDLYVGSHMILRTRVKPQGSRQVID